MDRSPSDRSPISLSLGVRIEHLEHYPAGYGATRKSVFEQLPHRFRNTAVVCVHPETVVTGSAGNMDFRHRV